MANVAGYRLGLHNATSTYDSTGHSPALLENLPPGRAASISSNGVTNSTAWRSNGSNGSNVPNDYTRTNATDAYPSNRSNGNPASRSDEDIPENMYRPDKDHPEGWIHRDKLAKIENEELQAAGINLPNANTRTMSQSRPYNERRQRLNSPPEDGEEDAGTDTALQNWDIRLVEEIEAEHLAASQMYANPILRKSGSKIPILAASPLPIPAERYERDVPILRKRAASGTMSFEGDLSVAKIRNSAQSKSLSTDDSDTSKPGSPEKLRVKSATLNSVSSAKPTTPAVRKVSAPQKFTSVSSQRPITRSGETDRPRTAVNRPEGDPPWLATMYKPDPRLPPDQQLIPTLAKKQMQAQWAEEGAIPKSYDRDFTPIAVHNEQDLADEVKRRSMLLPVLGEDTRAEPTPDSDPNAFVLRPLAQAISNGGRPGTSGSITGSYSTMPKVTSPITKVASTFSGPNAANMSGPIPTTPTSNTAARSAKIPPPARVQAHNLAEDDAKAQKGCGCCIVM